MNLATANPIVAVEDLHLAYRAKPVLDGLTWRIAPGQVVGLLGRNGAGKTTLLESILGMREPRGGSVRVFGKPAHALDDGDLARIGYVPQQANLFEWMTASQLLAYFRSFYPRWNDAKVAALLERWQIDRDVAIARLSGGQQQRLSIVRALAHDPDLLVLDEPVASLDPIARRDFLQQLVGEVVDRGTTVVFSTHILSDLERVAFDVAFLAAGRIVVQAPLDSLLEEVRSVTGPADDVRREAAARGWHVLRESPLDRGVARLLTRSDAQEHMPGTSRFDVRAVTLDDLYSELTQ